MPEAFSEPQRLLARAAAWLCVVSLVTGLVAGGGMTHLLPVDGRVALSAHLNAMMGTFLLLGVAWSLPMLAFGPVGQQRLAWAFIAPNYGNWAITLTKAFLGVAGLELKAPASNAVVFVLLQVVVVVPSLVAALAWGVGLTRRRA